MDPHSTPDGILRWGIKDSFRDYLSRQADFSLGVDSGAAVGAGNTIEFSLVEAQPEAGQIQWSARGRAIFRAHGGMMRLVLKDPVVTLEGADLLLAFDFGSEPAGAAPDLFEVARLVEVPSGDSGRRTFQAFLLPDATGMFNDMYDAGSELDEVVIDHGSSSGA